MVVFARQNVMSDPPFSRMDIISCRNLLIYFEAAAQQRIFPVFHYALKPGGFLYLGASESIGGFTELFEPLDKKHKIYTKKAAPTPAFQLLAAKDRGEPSDVSRRIRGRLQPRADQGGAADGLRGELTAQREADRVSVNHFAPPAALIDANLQILQFRGPTGAYLEPPTGKATFDVLKMARAGLMMPLRSLIAKAKKENVTARKEHVRIEKDGEARTVNVEVIPLKNPLQAVDESAADSAPNGQGCSDRQSRSEGRAAAASTQREDQDRREYDADHDRGKTPETVGEEQKHRDDLFRERDAVSDLD